MITLIAAVDQKNGIGKDGTIPWQDKDDMAFFKNETMGGVVIMGSRTWESLNKKRLKGRDNIIVGSTYASTESEDELYVKTIDEAVHKAILMNRRIYGIGGHKIYQEMLSFANRILLTRIQGDWGCDTFFPEFDQSYWKPNHMNIGSLLIEEYVRPFKNCLTS